VLAQEMAVFIRVNETPVASRKIIGVHMTPCGLYPSSKIKIRTVSISIWCFLHIVIYCSHSSMEISQYMRMVRNAKARKRNLEFHFPKRVHFPRQLAIEHATSSQPGDTPMGGK
jgi:hypothetical protein